MMEQIEILNEKIRISSDKGDNESVVNLIKERQEIVNGIEDIEERKNIIEKLIEHDKKILNYLNEKVDGMSKELISNVNKNKAYKKYSEY